MNIFIITLIAFASMIFLMAIGVILSNIVIKGSCGGLGKITGDSCAFCKADGQCKEELNDSSKEKIMNNIVKVKEYKA